MAYGVIPQCRYIWAMANTAAWGESGSRPKNGDGSLIRYSGSAAAQNIRPAAMVVHRLMANQLNLLSMGLASFPPMTVSPNLEKQA